MAGLSSSLLVWVAATLSPVRCCSHARQARSLAAGEGRRRTEAFVTTPATHRSPAGMMELPIMPSPSSAPCQPCFLISRPVLPQARTFSSAVDIERCRGHLRHIGKCCPSSARSEAEKLQASLDPNQNRTRHGSKGQVDAPYAGAAPLSWQPAREHHQGSASGIMAWFPARAASSRRLGA